MTAKRVYTDAEVDAIVLTHKNIVSAHHTPFSGRGFRVTRTTALSVPHEWSYVVCNTKEYDPNNEYNTTTGKYAPTIAGYYYVAGNVTFDVLPDSTKYAVRVAKNGAGINLDIGVTGGTSHAGGCATGMIYLNGSTDYLQLAVYQYSGVPKPLLIGSGFVVFSGWLLTPP